MKASGINSEIMNTLSRKLNFTWSIMYPMSGTFGVEAPNGSIDGIVGDLRETF